jgi:hypothetical protein
MWVSPDSSRRQILRCLRAGNTRTAAPSEEEGMAPGAAGPGGEPGHNSDRTQPRAAPGHST